jgi:hypothetical protein
VKTQQTSCEPIKRKKVTNPMATFLDQTQLTIQGNWFGFANVNSPESYNIYSINN